MRSNIKILGAVAVAGVVAATGSAFTAGGTLPAATGVKSYASQEISGVAAESVTYNTNAAGDAYVSVSLVLTGDTSTKTIKIAFNGDTPTATCGTADITSTAGKSKYTCTTTQAVNTATKFALVAS